MCSVVAPDVSVFSHSLYCLPIHKGGEGLPWTGVLLAVCWTLGELQDKEEYSFSSAGTTEEKQEIGQGRPCGAHPWLRGSFKIKSKTLPVCEGLCHILA